MIKHLAPGIPLCHQAPMIKRFLNMGLISTLANGIIFWTTSYWFIMPIFFIINFTSLCLPHKHKTNSSGSFFYKGLTNKNTAYILHGLALALLGILTLINGELVSTLAIAYIILGSNQVTDAVSQAIQEHYAISPATTYGMFVRFARLNQYSMPLAHAVGYCFLAFATGAQLLVVPPCIAATAGAFFGMRGYKEYALLSFSFSAFLAACLVIVPAYYEPRLFFGYLLYSLALMVRFADYRQTQIKTAQNTRQ